MRPGTSRGGATASSQLPPRVSSTGLTGLRNSRLQAVIGNSAADRSLPSVVSAPVATLVAYNDTMLQRPLISPVKCSTELNAFQTRDLLASRRQRIDNAQSTSGALSVQAIAKSIVQWQSKTRHRLHAAEKSIELSLRSGDADGGGGYHGDPTSRPVSTHHAAAAHSQVAQAGFAASDVDPTEEARWKTAKERELVEERQAAEVNAALTSWRAQQLLLSEGIEARIQGRRRPRSTNMVAKVEHRQGVTDALVRPTVLASPTAAAPGPAAAPASPSKPSTSPSISRSAGAAPLPVLTRPTSVLTGPSSVAVSLPGGRHVSLDFPAPPAGHRDPRMGLGRRPDYLDDDTGVGGGSAVIDALIGGGDPVQLVSSRPGTAASTGRSTSPMQMRSPRAANAAAGGDDAGDGPTAPHQVKYTTRLPIPIIVTGAGMGAQQQQQHARPATTGSMNRSRRHADRPSMAGWWSTTGKAEAAEREDAEVRAVTAAASSQPSAAAAAQSEADASGFVLPSTTHQPPMGPAGVACLPEVSIQRPPPLLKALPALSQKMNEEQAYDVGATVTAFHKFGLASSIEAQKVARALVTGLTPAGAAAQASRPMSASSGYFGLGENPVMRQRRLDMLRNQALAAGKGKGAGGKGKKAGKK